MITPNSTGDIWPTTSQHEKLSYVTSACEAWERLEGKTLNPQKVLVGIDDFFGNPSNRHHKVSFGFGMALSGVDRLGDYDSRLSESTE